MNYSNAIILKNYRNSYNRILLFDSVLGVIHANYSQKSRASLLTTGSIIHAALVIQGNRYILQEYDSVYVQPILSDHALHFLHEIAQFCMHALPNNVSIPDVFDFLRVILTHLDQLNTHDVWYVQCRLLWFIDALPADILIHKTIHDRKLFEQILETHYQIINQLVTTTWPDSLVMRKI